MRRFLLIMGPAAILLSIAVATSGAPYPVGGAQGGGYGSGGDEEYAGPGLFGPPPPERERIPKRTGPPGDAHAAPASIPLTFSLRMISRNPAGSAALFEFDLPRPTLVTAKLLDVLGREVARPASQLPFTAGTRQLRIALNGFASGTYLCRLQFETPATGESREFTYKIIHLR